MLYSFTYLFLESNKVVIIINIIMTMMMMITRWKTNELRLNPGTTTED